MIERYFPVRMKGQRLACKLLLLAVVLVSAKADAAVVAEPTLVVFDSYQDSATVKLTLDGKPVSAKDVRGWKFLVGEHDYRHMASCKVEDGVLTLAPTPALEVGTYDLVVSTTAGPAVVLVYAPLSALPEMLENRAAAIGATTEELKKKLGLYTEAPLGAVRLELPPVYYEGQALTLAMPLKADVVYVWAINDKIVLEGAGKNEFVYTFPAPGDYTLTYAEKKTGAVVSSTCATTRVAPVPPVPVEVEIGTKLTVHGPDGYQEVVWKVEGTEVSRGPALTYRFSRAGEFTIECMAKSPLKGLEEGFCRVPYKVKVLPRKR